MVANGTVKNGGKNEKVQAATLDEAMLMSGLGVYNILHMLLCGLILMGVIMQSLALGYVLPAAQCDLDLTLQQRGWIAAIPFMAMILTGYFWGWLADTRGRRPVLLYSMMTSFLLTVLVSFTPNMISFAVLQFLSAIFMSGSSAVAYTYLGEFNNLRHRDKMVAFGSAFVGIGTVVLPAISWLILPLDFAYYISFLNIYYRPWRLLVVACGIPYALSSIIMCFAPESPKFLTAAGRQEEVLAVMKTIYSVNYRMPKDTFGVETIIVDKQAATDEKLGVFRALLKSMREQTLPLFRAPLLPWTLLTCFVQFGIFATTNGFYVWFPTILNSVVNHDGGPMRICDVLAYNKHGNDTEVGCDDTMNTATFEQSIYIGLVFSSMYIIVGFLVDFIGKKLILIVVLSATGLCGIGAHFAANTQLAVILFAIFQMSGACIGLMNAVAVELFPTKYRAMAVCLCMMMGRAGSMVGSNLIGVFLQSNCGLSFYLFGGILIVNAAFCITLPNKKKNNSPAKEIPAEPTENETHEPV
ncbi:synaptic vesicle glycoprotein 2C [Amyelois transitella]|uniref:synaptic vesicle glycoprotein 2C n=1 Tax=Amyelois transitella TaxID=680683 RepID=UPI00067D6240|nr:synaptic vesicle glycoprotein 2C [Amyelois transitella]